MGKQSRLEKIGIERRDALQMKNEYYNDVAKNVKEEYSDQHKDAIADGDKLGKGTGMDMGITIPGQTESSAISRSNFVTTVQDSPNKHVGGSYDEDGYGALKGNSGRNYLSKINLYFAGDGNEYGSNSVDTTLNVADGQIITTIS